MKKLGLLVAGAFLLTACDATPKGNKSILPVEHDEAVEHVDHHEAHGEHDGHEGHTEENHDAHHATAESKDSANKSADTQKVEKDVDAKKVDESPENAAH